MTLKQINLILLLKGTHNMILKNGENKNFDVFCFL